MIHLIIHMKPIGNLVHHAKTNLKYTGNHETHPLTRFQKLSYTSSKLHCQKQWPKIILPKTMAIITLQIFNNPTTKILVVMNKWGRHITSIFI